MTSGVRFESSDLLEEKRQDIREAREKILENAKIKYEIEEKKRQQAKLRGEDKWMLPSVDCRITKETNEISSKKKKVKKEKKKKKKKKKCKDSSSDNSDEVDEWVEAPVSIPARADTTNQIVIKGPTMPQRESWMEAPLDCMPLTSRQEIRDKKKESGEEEKKESVIEQMGQHARELNPYWKDGGGGVPSEKPEKDKLVSSVGDGGLQWLKKSYLRIKEQAKLEGKCFEEMAAERWGSVEKIEKMIADAEKASRHSNSSLFDRRSTSSSPHAKSSRADSEKIHPNFQRPSSSNNDKGYSCDRSRDRPRFQRPSSPDGIEEKFVSDRHSDRDRNHNRDNDRRYRMSSFPKERREQSGRFQRPRSPDCEGYSGSPSRRYKQLSLDSDKKDSQHKTNRSDSRSPDRRRFRRPSADSESKSSRSKSHRSRSRSPSKTDYGRRRDGYRSNRDVPRWKKLSVDDKSDEKNKDSVVQESKSKSSQSTRRNSSSQSKKRHKSSSSSVTSSSTDSSSSEESKSESEDESPPTPPPQPVLLTETEMNEVAAKILKAEIMGDERLATELRTKLELAREAKKNAPPPSATKPSIDNDEDEVLLTRTTKTGFVIPLSERRHPKESHKRRKRQKKISTHEDGERKRYFDDDDNIDLKTMVEREKMGTAEDQNSMFARLAGRSIEKTDDDYQVDDMFISKAARKQSESKLEEQDKMKAIMEHQKMSSALDKCQFCFNKVPKHLIIAIGKKSYLCLPQHKPLSAGHCLIVPMMHCNATTAIDEDVWQEMQTFRKTLANLFRERGEDAIFMETSMFLKRQLHTYIECIPLDIEVGDLAPIYFKKAIQDCESEWSQNIKLVDLSKKDIRHSVPKGFPYFCVDFGLHGGFAHVIEDEHKFPTYFGREIVGGMIDANHRLWKNPPKESFDEQRIRVLEFSEWWQPHDWTQTID